MTVWLPGLAAVPRNAAVALLAAASWGGGDFTGGMGVKVSGGSTRASLRVIIAAHSASLAALVLACWLTGGEPFHPARAMVWALLAGVTAGFSITVFYLSLASGAMGAPAALSGLLAAAVPAAASTLLEGRPSLVTGFGFLVAGAAIWLIASAPGSGSDSRQPSSSRPLFLAILGGFGFGVYFVLLRLANPLGVLLPITLARAGSTSTCLLLLLVLRSPKFREKQPMAEPAPSGALTWVGLDGTALRWAMATALLDTGGNLLFIASTRMGRLDIASVLASLYPASTILLAAFYLHERPARQQLVGMGLALAAVVLVTR